MHEKNASCASKQKQTIISCKKVIRIQPLKARLQISARRRESDDAHIEIEQQLRREEQQPNEQNKIRIKTTKHHREQNKRTNKHYRNNHNNISERKTLLRE